ncbi:MAG: ABC transporter [Fulvimarina sp.]|nr:ABC transporter [Fulvimarina sp.]
MEASLSSHAVTEQTSRPVVLGVEKASYRYRKGASPVFSDLDLSLRAGEFVSLVGGSGVGKSTVLRCLAGLLPLDGGRLHLDVERAEGSRRRSVVFQDSRLLPWRTVGDNIAYGIEGLGLSKGERSARVDEVLTLVNMLGYRDRWPSDLSGGQSQRVGIARALAVRPKIVLMDEPFSAVDALTRRHLQDELLGIWSERELAVLFVTHDIREATYLSDRILVMGGSPARVVHDEPMGRRSRDRVHEDTAQEAAADRISAAMGGIDGEGI